MLKTSARILTAALLLVAAMGIGSCAGVGQQRASEPRRPNIIVILADDLGYGDMSTYGGSIPTPNIDRLAASGVRFTSGYVPAAVCAPSRAALLSGRQQTRFGFEFNPVGRDEMTGLPLGETTIAQMLKGAGYVTGIVGKWHIGQAAGFHPLDRGFDSFFGVLGGATDFITRPAEGDIAAVIPGDNLTTRTRFPVSRGREVVEEPRYLTEAFTEEARGFIRTQRDKPFFLYLAYTAPHTPLQATKTYADRFPDIASPYQRTYAAMVSALDDGVGAIMGELRAQGLERDTVVIFLSDNGCAGYIRGGCTNRPLEAGKGTPWEGGIRVPFILAAPGRIPAGVVDDRVISSLDIMTTAAQLAGTRAPQKAEGADLVAALTTARDKPVHDALSWRMGPNHAVREGRWKLIVVNKSDTIQNLDKVYGEPVPDGIAATVGPLGQWVLLYDLDADPGETRNLAAQYPEVVQRLSSRFETWNALNVEPIFTSRRQFHSLIGEWRVQLFN
ncbi:sulfatase-like hydrolase/transferase [Caulobacter sp. NIBR1757]|uniref:sulfatase-like hydrolase/transferase n=1 Tax=Caulobacter sp. NIBR1757 TaxID=3016000 RepID=UPI0022F051CC|nr:sulfatase-like hydrolase/transferase [Caulobacter sp. NIBR1757]WGM40634.1 Arylsulfatase [Caulobacter sp. NIBR1757]